MFPLETVSRIVASRVPSGYTQPERELVHATTLEQSSMLQRRLRILNQAVHQHTLPAVADAACLPLDAADGFCAKY